MKVYSLLDRKVREFGQLLLAPNADAMRRTALDVIKGSGSLIEKYPEDFDLYEVGEFEPGSGVITGGTPHLVANMGTVLSGGSVVEHGTAE